ncbi:MAG TPA: hypothetical protein DCE33_15555 [Rhodospirillaceae bacterium]|nr:hypothetical protein [Rhodospirillaceae bacterium]
MSPAGNHKRLNTWVSTGNGRYLFAGLLAGALGLAGCLTTSDERANYDRLQELVDNAKSESINDKFVKSGLQALADGKAHDANRHFGRALKFDPGNSRLHFLNGLAYHLRAEAGDGAQFDFAKVGYGLALQFDPSDYWAHYLLGRIEYRQRNYHEAQEAFASATLLAPDKPQILLALAAASYYRRDLKTAYTAILRAAKKAPDNPKIAQAAAIIFAASGKFDDAKAELVRFGELDTGNKFREQLISTRLKDWRQVHAGIKASATSAPGQVQLAQDASDILGSDAATEGISPSSSDSSGLDDSSTTTDSTAAKKPKIPKMALVDLTIIRSEEISSTTKGVNLLTGLQVAFNYTALSLNDTKTQDLVNPANSTHTLTNTKLVSLAAPAAINYSLNIFNDNVDYNEVLARPTLTAVDGKTSEFFSGAILHVELDGVAGSQGTVESIPVGVRLQVTPTFLSDETVRYDVQAARAFIENRAAQAGFNNFTQTSKTEVKGSVVMKFGETLVISGLSEREDERLKDGVPFLQSLPGVQYFFSQENTTNTKKSVLILVTPRKPRYTYSEGTPKPEAKAKNTTTAQQPNLKTLKSRPDWFKHAHHVDAIIGHMKDRPLFRQFRAGDVSMEEWENPFTLTKILERTISFLYY